MKLWVPLAVVSLIIMAYAVIYEIGIEEAQGASSLGFANSIGLLAVFVGLIAAGFVLRRATPHS
jgi:ABC-type antimicrobial peptide transport system permease subunit